MSSGDAPTDGFSGQVAGADECLADLERDSRSRSARHSPRRLPGREAVGGQRHVSLVPARTSDIRELIERGTCEEPPRNCIA